MGANSTQGVAVLLFLVGFTCLAGAFFSGGNFLFLLLFLVATGASIAMFLKVKPLEEKQK